MKNEHDGLRSVGNGGGSSPEAVTLQVASPLAGERSEKAAAKRKRKAAKLRGVWISFTGRIVAQFVGSAASILLGLALIQSYKSPAQASEKTAAGLEATAYQGRVAPAGAPGTPRRQSIVVLPIDDYSGAGLDDRFAPALTEFVTATLADRGSLAVLSRTSASQIDTRHRSVPAIARELGVDFVLEASVTRGANRVRVVAQLIDGRSDEHLWTGRYDRQMGEILALQAEIAGEIAAGVEAVSSRSAPRSDGTAGRSTSAHGGAESVAPAQALPLAAALLKFSPD